MRIIAGTHKGRKINHKNNLNVRPTTDRAKEGLFNIIENRYFLTEKNMLDLFSGTGNIAFEFASRGVENIIAVDNNPHCLESIKNTSEDFKLNINTVQSDVLKYVKSCQNQFNFIFADPPYNYKGHQELKEMIINGNLIKKDGLLIIEHDREITFDDKNVDTRKYGAVHFSLFYF